MKHIYEGKTKTVFELADGNYLLRFKDDVTGENGHFDPGANTVGLSIEGMGRAGLRMSAMFFEKLNEMGMPTHYISSDQEAATMTVRGADAFGKGVEVICRYRAVGSFIRRYGLYAEDGMKLDGYVEFTLKDDARQDPLINAAALAALGIMTKEEHDGLTMFTRQISDMVAAEIADKGAELYDIKLEFGRAKSDGSLMLIDEISAGNMRVYKDNKVLEPLELAALVLGEKQQ